MDLALKIEKRIQYRRAKATCCKMFVTIKTLCCYERFFELHFVVYKAAYKQV
jgi:hypothetical protein